MQTRWKVVQPPRGGFVDTFVRNAWTLDYWSMSNPPYTGYGDRYGMINTALNLPTSFTGSATYADVGFSHAGITSSPTNMFFTRTKGAPTSYYHAIRMRLSDGGYDTVDYFAGDSDGKASVSALCPYTDDIGFIVIDYNHSSTEEFKLNKIDFASGTSTTMISFPIDGTGYGDQSSDLSMHWVTGLNGFRLVYPYLRWHLDGSSDPDYATDVDWYIFDPVTETEDVVSYHWDDPFLMPDGYNVFSNSVIIGNKLTTFVGYDDYAAPNKAEVHCLDLVLGTVTVTRIDTSDVNSFVPRGSAPSASENAVYCCCECYDDASPFDSHKLTYKYIPSTNTLSLSRDTLNFGWESNYNALADSHYAYILESDGADQQLIRLSDGSTVLTTAIADSASPTIDDDRHGLITAIDGSSDITIYYDDSTTKTITVGTASGDMCLYLHRERLFVVDLPGGSTRSYYIVVP
jgi:hypothetical protein